MEDELHCPILLSAVGLPDICSQKCVITQNRKVSKAWRDPTNLLEAPWPEIGKWNLNPGCLHGVSLDS